MGDLNNQYRYKVQIVKPQAGKNLIKNPIPYYRISEYGSSNAAISLNSVNTRRGPQCIRVVPVSGVNSSVYYTGLPVVSGLAYTFSVDVLGVKGQAMRIYIANNSGTPKATLQFTATGNWQRKSVTWIADETAANYRVYVSRDPVASTDPFWVDGFQFEEGSKATTFIQGWRSGLGYMDNFPEYGWEGTPGNSPSLRSQWTRHGGELVDIRDYAGIMKVEGLGMSPFTQVTTPIVTGGVLYQKHIRKARPFSIDVQYKGANIQELQRKRQAILDLLRPDYSPYEQPLILRIQTLNDKNEEVSDPVDVVCVFETSHTNPPNDVTSQRDTLYFTALDGHLLGAFKNGSTLDYKVSFTASHLLKRDPNGRWTDDTENNLMDGIVSNGGGIGAIREAPNGDIYVCGQFAGVKNGASSVANTLNIARWSKANQLWEAVGNPVVGATFNYVNCMEFDASGNLYIGGDFQNLAGIANADNFAKYNPTTNTWSALGSGINNGITDIAISPEGTIYICGAFTSASGNSDCKRVAYWDGSVWAPLAAGLNAIVYGMKFHPAGDLIICGYFTNATGTNGKCVCYWRNGAFYSFEDLGATPLNASAYAVDITPDGTIVIGGFFENVGGNPGHNYIAKWNGTNWEKFGDASLSGYGGAGNVSRIYCAPNGDVYVSGYRLAVNGVLPTNMILIYKNGYYQSPEIATPVVTHYFNAFLQVADGTLYMGGNFYTSITAAQPKEMEYKITASSGSANTYPLIEVVGPGKIESISNYSTGRTIRFNNLTLLEGEKIWLHLDPVNLTITSSWKGRGSVWRYLNAGSDIGDWYMQPGKNSIGVFIPSGFDVNETKAYITWQPKYWGLEGSVHE